MAISRMLINASQAEEIRVALVNGSRLENLDLEIHGREQQKANIYKGKITRIEPSLEAVFVDYGAERHGFLPFREISSIYHKTTGNPEVDNKMSMREKIHEGLEIIIQVEKESRGNKGAALTTYVSLAGCYLVLMPNNPKAGGISRRIDGDERAEVREVLSQLQIPEEMGMIVRTAGMGRDIKDLQWDLDVLLQQWRSIEAAANERPAPFLIYQESNLVVRAIRDHLRPEITEILVDSQKVYDDAAMHIRMMRPDFISKLKLYNDSIPLFSRFQIESQIEMAFQREVTLPSGGAIVIDHTEALISIDINSAKATKGGDIEETAYHTNLEAADEIARQLRLRDIGGLIVIDFIDMNVVRNQRAVEQRLKEALEMDRARVQVGRISRFGLLEMSRQRLRPALAAARDIICPRCSGQGTIRSVEVLALNMVRLIEEEAIKDNTAQVHLEVPVEVATYLINEKRQAIIDMERKHHIRIVLMPSQHLNTPNYVLKRIKKDELVEGQGEPVSYSLTSKPEVPKGQYNKPNTARSNVPAVASFNPNNIATPPKTGLIRRVLSSIFGGEEGSADQPNESELLPKPNMQRRPQNQRGQQPRNVQGGSATAGSSNNRNRNNRNRNNRPRNDNRNANEAPANVEVVNDASANTELSTTRANEQRNQQQREPRQPRNQQQREPRANQPQREPREPRNNQQREPREPRNQQHREPKHDADHVHNEAVVEIKDIEVTIPSHMETTSTTQTHFSVAEVTEVIHVTPEGVATTQAAPNQHAEGERNNRKRTGHRRHQYRKGRYRQKRTDGAEGTNAPGAEGVDKPTHDNVQEPAKNFEEN